MAPSFMGRLFYFRGGLSSYIEKSSKTSLFGGRDQSTRRALAQKLFNFSTLWGGERAPKAGAFQGRRRGRETQCRRNVRLLGNGERKSAVEDVARAQRIHGVHRKGPRAVQRLSLVEPERAFRALRPRHKGWRQLCDFSQCLGIVGDPRGRLQRLARKYQMRGGRQQALPQGHGAVDIDHDRNAAVARFGAKFSAEFGAAVFRQDGVAIAEQFVRVGQADFPQPRIAESDDGALSAGIDQDI